MLEDERREKGTQESWFHYFHNIELGGQWEKISSKIYETRWFAFYISQYYNSNYVFYDRQGLFRMLMGITIIVSMTRTFQLDWGLEHCCFSW